MFNCGFYRHVREPKICVTDELMFDITSVIASVVNINELFRKAALKLVVFRENCIQNNCRMAAG